MPLYTDQTGHTIEISKPPERIISLVPSQTELLYDLGLDEQVAGITKFCVHPAAWFARKPRIGGTKTVNLQAVNQLKPDIIIANKEENTREDIEKLKALYPVWISDIADLKDALQMIKSLGEITNTLQRAVSMIDSIKSAFAAFDNETISSHPSTAYLIWRDPYMAAGGDTFIHAMMKICGFRNIYKNTNRYPIVTIEDLQQAGCELLLLSSEPYPFNDRHASELQPALPATRIRLVDGEMFSWYGSRLLLAPGYFEQLLTTIDA